MRIRSFIIAYALVLAILLFADRRPGGQSTRRYSHRGGPDRWAERDGSRRGSGSSNRIEDPNTCAGSANSPALGRRGRFPPSA